MCSSFSDMPSTAFSSLPQVLAEEHAGSSPIFTGMNSAALRFGGWPTLYARVISIWRANSSASRSLPPSAFSPSMNTSFFG